MKPILPAILIIFCGVYTSFAQGSLATGKERPACFFKASYELLQHKFEELNVSKRGDEISSNAGIQLHFLNFPLAAGFYDKNGRNFHEFALSRLQYSKLYIPENTLSDSVPYVINDSEIKSAVVGLRYEFNLKLGKRNDRKSKFYLGFPVECYYVHRAVTPYRRDQFPSRTNGFGFTLGVTPRYQYWITQHFYLDIAIPVTAYDGLVFQTKRANVNIPQNDRTASAYYSYLGTPFANFRIGLGMKI
jgi:hypothetical protein